jgi:hypothetical protein
VLEEAPKVAASRSSTLRTQESLQRYFEEALPKGRLTVWHQDLREPLEKIALAAGLPPSGFQCLIYRESGFQAGALSQKGALTLAQLMPESLKLVKTRLQGGRTFGGDRLKIYHFIEDLRGLASLREMPLALKRKLHLGVDLYRWIKHQDPEEFQPSHFQNLRDWLRESVAEATRQNLPLSTGLQIRIPHHLRALAEAYKFAEAPRILEKMEGLLQKKLRIGTRPGPIEALAAAAIYLTLELEWELAERTPNWRERSEQERFLLLSLAYNMGLGKFQRVCGTDDLSLKRCRSRLKRGQGPRESLHHLVAIEKCALEHSN